MFIWKNVLRYEPETGNLIWIIKPAKNVAKGAVAGTLNKFGYIQFRYNGVIYRAHRVIWEMFNGPIPDGMEIDHQNHNRADNRLANLRVVTKQENAMNRLATGRNRSGAVGVSFDKERCKWLAQITKFRKTKTIGRFDDFDEAVAARKAAEAAYGFHENHGETA